MSLRNRAAPSASTETSPTRESPAAVDQRLSIKPVDARSTTSIQIGSLSTDPIKLADYSGDLRSNKLTLRLMPAVSNLDIRQEQGSDSVWLIGNPSTAVARLTFDKGEVNFQWRDEARDNSGTSSLVLGQLIVVLSESKFAALLPIAPVACAASLVSRSRVIKRSPFSSRFSGMISGN